MWLQGFFGPRQLCRVRIGAPEALPSSNSPRLFLILQIGPRRLDTPGLGRQVRRAGAVLAGLAAAKGAGRGGLTGGSTLLEVLEQLGDGRGRQVLVVVVVDLDHGGVDAGTQALDLDKGEEAVGRGLALLDAELLLDGLDDDVGTAATELAGSLERVSQGLCGVWGSRACESCQFGPESLQRTVVQAWTKNLPTGVRLYMV